MTDRLVSFETAELAKQKGFNYPVLTVFAQEDGKYGLHPWKKGDVNMWYPGESFTDEDNYSEVLEECCYLNNGEHVACPTQSLLQKWLREVHNFHFICDVDFDDKGKLWYKWRGYKPEFGASRIGGISEQYETALEEFEQEALKLLP